MSPAPIFDPETSDEELLLRVARGDAAAFEALYDRYARRLYGLALRMFRSQDQAEDALQEAFSRIWLRAGLYNPERGRAVFWLMRLGRNLYLDRLRARRRMEERIQADAFYDEYETSAPGPESAVQLDSLAQSLRRGLQTLAPELQTVIEMSFFMGLSHSEIAAKLNLAPGTVKTRLRRGMDKLRDWLRREKFSLETHG
jgi:RNA polymerase sigma-70 factor, ECF subfamily